jgi:hypothetical protein
MKTVPLFGAGIQGRSLPVTAQRRLNCYFEQRPDGDKSSIVVYGTPGLVNLGTLPAVIRRMLGTQTLLYVVAGTQLYSVSTSYVQTALGTLNTNSGTVSMANNPSQIMIVDGVAGYLYTPATGTFKTITSPGFPNGANTVTFVSGYFVCEQPGSQQFWVSNLYDGSTWNALAFASAAQYSDNIKAVDNLIGNLILFSEKHTEFWQNVGTTPEPFAPVISATSEFGIAAIYSRAHVNQTICFLGSNPQGAPQVVQITGYNMAVISTPDLDYIMAKMPTVSDAIAISYVVNGHPMYQITFPTADRSFMYDTATGLWSEMQTGTTTKYSTRHIAQYSTYFAGLTVVSEANSGNIDRFDTSVFTDNGQTIPREVITRHASNEFNTFTISEVYLDIEAGVGLTTGQGSTPTLLLDVSKDNGRTYSTPRQLQLGPLGNYRQRLIARRFGSARDFVFRVRMSDPVQFTITDGAITVQEGTP